MNLLKRLLKERKMISNLEFINETERNKMLKHYDNLMYDRRLLTKFLKENNVSLLYQYLEKGRI